MSEQRNAEPTPVDRIRKLIVAVWQYELRDFRWIVPISSLVFGGSAIVVMLRYGFISRWKEISIIFTGLFAVLGIFFDTKDKMTGSITLWGRVFFVLTVISVACAFIGQSWETSDERTRNRIAQENMTSLLTRTQQTVLDISRSLQPIETPTVHFVLNVDCKFRGYVNFCNNTREAQLQNYPGSSSSYFMVDKIDWTTLPQEFLLAIKLDFYHSGSDTNRFFTATCSICLNSDLLIRFQGDDYEKKNIMVEYRFDPAALRFTIEDDHPYVTVNSPHFLVVPDFDGSTVIISDLNNNLNGLEPSNLTIITKRGQWIAFHNFSPQTRKDEQVFISISDSQSKSKP